MSIKLESTTDSQEQVTAALGSKKELADTEVKEEAKESVSPKEGEEIESKDSEALEKEVGQEDDQEKDEEEDVKEDVDKPKKKGGFQKKINKLTSKIAWLEDELAKRSSVIEPEKEQKQEAKTNEGKPKAEDFEYHSDYVEALADWKLDQKLKEVEQSKKEETFRDEQQALIFKHQQRVQEYSSKHDDFIDAIEDLDDVPMSVTVQEVIVNSDIGPEIMHELSKDKKLYEKICAMSPLSAAKALGAIESKIQNSKESSEKKEIKTTKAPAPIKPIGSQSSVSTKSIEDMSMAEYKKFRGY